MVEQLKKSSTRLACGITLLFTLAGIYMLSMRIGPLYRTVDGYLILLPVFRLGLMVVIVGLVLGLAGTVGETIIDGFGAAFKQKTWQVADEGPRTYKDLLRYLLLLIGLLIGYLMLHDKVLGVISPLDGWGWVPLVFSLAWLTLSLAAAALFIRKILRSRDGLRDWFVSSRQTASALKAGRMAQGAQHQASQAKFPVPQQPASAAPTAAAKRFCAKCGAPVMEEYAFCKQCGADLRR